MRGVLTELPLTEPVGVEVPVVVEASVPLLLAACFAAFSASRFCLDAEGGIVRGVYGVGNECVVCGWEGGQQGERREEGGEMRR